MRHFSSEQWADFVRDVVGAHEKAAMQAHLETGCNQCSDEVKAWTRVREAAMRERSYQPPESVVRMAKALAAINARPSRRPIAQLLFDSFQMPALAGVRAAAAGPRQMLYGIGDYRIDIRIEPKPEGDVITMVGQILISEEPARAASRVYVSLVRGRDVLATAETNEYGEFELQCELPSGLKLHVAPPEGPHIDIPLFEAGRKGASKTRKSTDSKGFRAKNRKNKRST